VLRLEASKFNGRAIGPHLPGYVEFRADKSDEPVAGAAEFLAELAPQLFLDGAVCAAVPFRADRRIFRSLPLLLNTARVSVSSTRIDRLGSRPNVHFDVHVTQHWLPPQLLPRRTESTLSAAASTFPTASLSRNAKRNAW
jgi:hypothetical protein